MAGRNTLMKDGKLLVLDVKAATLIEEGKIVAVDATGMAVPGADTAGLTVMGSSDKRVDNSGGADGDLGVPVKRKASFLYANASGNAVTAAHIGKTVYVEDDETVASSSTNSIPAGKCLGVESSGVWVEHE